MGETHRKLTGINKIELDPEKTTTRSQSELLLSIV